MTTREKQQQTTPTLEENKPTKNFSPHISALEEEGRRNQPKNHSPKKAKARRSEKNKAEADLKKEMGAFAPFAS